MRAKHSAMQFTTSDINLTDVIDVISTGEAGNKTQTGQIQNTKSTSASQPYRDSSKMNFASPTSIPSYNIKIQDPNRQKKSAFVKIVEEPAGKGLRFRYECEGRSAGSIPGANSTPDNRSFPTIQVDGYVGRAVVVASCVTSEPPYRPHPHQLVGKDGCKKGVCTMEISSAMSCSFPNLGIQCVKKKDIEDALALRQQIRVDPFQTGFSHKSNSQSIDLNCVRLCFQVFLEGNEEGAFTFALKPVVSHPIYDKKAKCDLTICRITETCAPAVGGKEILLFCDKISKDDIQIRFFQEVDGQVVWEGLADFQASDVHKQFGICFRTPRYNNIEIESPVQVKMQLRRPSDGAVSESRPFEFLPLDMGRSYWSAKRLKTNYTIFNQILASDQNSRLEHQQSLKHKQPIARGRAPITNIQGVFSHQINEQNIRASQCQANISSETLEDTNIVTTIDKNEDEFTIEKMQPQPSLKPVAMPGFVRMPGTGTKQENKSLYRSDIDTDIKIQTKPIPTGIHEVGARSREQSGSHPYDPAGSSEAPAKPQSTGYFMPNPPPINPLESVRNIHMEPHNRPISEISNQSEFSTITSKTQQSVNDILSMAEDISVYSLDTNRYSINDDDQSNRFSMDIDNIGVSDVGLNIKEEPNQFMNLHLQECLKNPVLDIMGSMTSVSTVKENKSNMQTSEKPYSTTPVQKESETIMSMNCSEMDLAEIYDDVMQCVYDDVDTKYDDIEISTHIQAEAPVPPLRKSGLSVDKEIDKPLPGLPKNPSLLHKFAEKKEELLKEREKKRAYDEQKRKEREIQEEKRKRDREEKENKLKEEKEKRRIEEEQKKEMRRKEEEEKKIKKNLEIEKENKLKQSLFQRLFQRSQSKGESGEGGLDCLDDPATMEFLPPPVPPHGAISQQNESPQTNFDLESQITNMQQFIDMGNIENLDSMVSEFAKQCLPEAMVEQQSNQQPSTVSQL